VGANWTEQLDRDGGNWTEKVLNGQTSVQFLGRVVAGFEPFLGATGQKKII